MSLSLPETAFVSASAEIGRGAVIGDGCMIWHHVQIRENARLGHNCVIGQGAYLDAGVTLGDNCKVQNLAQVFAPAHLEDGVFIGPAAILTNDHYPRAITPNGILKSSDDWVSTGVTVRYGASIGAGAVVLPGVEIGQWAMVGAGAVVTGDVAARALVRGTPAVVVGWVGRGGIPLDEVDEVLIDLDTGERFRRSDEGLEGIQ